LGPLNSSMSCLVFDNCGIDKLDKLGSFGRWIAALTVLKEHKLAAAEICKQTMY